MLSVRRKSTFFLRTGLLLLLIMLAAMTVTQFVTNTEEPARAAELATKAQIAAVVSGEKLLLSLDMGTLIYLPLTIK